MDAERGLSKNDMHLTATVVLNGSSFRSACRRE